MAFKTFYGGREKMRNKFERSICTSGRIKTYGLFLFRCGFLCCLLRALFCCGLLCGLFCGCLLGGLFGGGFLGLLWGLLGSGLFGLLGLGFLGLWLLNLLGFLFLGSLEASLGLDEFFVGNQLLDGLTDEGRNLGYINLVVGSDVFLDCGQRGSLFVLQGLDGSQNHNAAWGMFSLLCGLLGLCRLGSSSFSHFENWENLTSVLDKV